LRELFIYYRVHAGQAAALQAEVLGSQAQLRHRFPGLTARLLRRDDDVADRQTWMETYATDSRLRPDGIDAALHAVIEAQAEAWRARIDGPRHTEVFTACAS
jgi:hypothetical protein